MRIMRLGFMLAATLLAPGCATLVTGSSDTVTVNTRPAGATCELERDGETIAVVNPTPGSISISKSRKDIVVRCEKSDFQNAEGVVGSEFQAMTFGNVLFGGLVGVAIDAGSGAMSNYEPSVTITMIPERFEDELERDRFFDDMRDEFSRQYDQTVLRIKEKCGSDKDQCDRQLKAADEGRAEKLKDIEFKRAQAVVGAETASALPQA